MKRLIFILLLLSSCAVVRPLAYEEPKKEINKVKEIARAKIAISLLIFVTAIGYN